MQSAETLGRLAVLDRDLIENTIREIHLLRSQAKFDALERYLAPKAVFEYVGDRRVFHYAGRYVGKKNIIELYKTINTEIEMLDSQLLNCIIERDRAFSRRRVAVRHRGTSRFERHEIWDVWRFCDGLVVSSQKLIDISAFGRLRG